MKIVKRAFVVLLALYLVFSLAASIVIQFCPDNRINRAIMNHRFGLLIANYDSDMDTFAILSPFCNHPDVFLLVVDFSEGIDLYTDGFDCFGEW